MMLTKLACKLGLHTYTIVHEVYSTLFLQCKVCGKHKTKFV